MVVDAVLLKLVSGRNPCSQGFQQGISPHFVDKANLTDDLLAVTWG